MSEQAVLANRMKDRLRLLSVCDVDDGSVIFERVWKWLRREDSLSLGNLVRSFFQIARQLDHGVVSRVVFETSSMQSSDNENRDAVPATRTGSLERMYVDLPVKATWLCRQMLCTMNEHVMVHVEGCRCSYPCITGRIVLRIARG